MKTTNSTTTTTTKAYRITSADGVDMGVYPGDSPAAALDEMARDAGYQDAEEATEVAGTFDGSIEEVVG